MTGTVLFALLPVVLLIGLGHALRRGQVLSDAFWPQAERLAYMVLLPSLFFHSLATAEISALPVLPLAGTLIAATIAVALLAILARPVAGGDGAAFTSVFQGAIRFNNYVGVTLAAGLFGQTGLALAAVCNAAIVPTVNILCVLVFARFGSARVGGMAVLRQIATNPLVLSSFAGITFQMLGLRLPQGLEPALKTLGAAALPMGLLCVGAALEFRAARRWLRPIAVASVIKFCVMPAATLAAAAVFGLTDQALVTAMVFQTLPTASSSFILARLLGGDAPLMAGITAVQTVLAMVMLPLVMALALP